ncbi:MAG: glycosyl transferase [marine bacterium B5-7]|nr:MAG: glycosyl transferase [marine bacterium B5-7]
MRVAVVIVNYQSGQYLKGCLDSIEAQTRQPDRVLVVDNNSIDGSTATLVGRPSYIQFIPVSTNLGFARANNIAFSFADDCDYLALLNPDAIAGPDWLKSLLEGVERHDAIDCYGCRMLGYTSDDPADGTADVYHVSGLYWRRDHGRAVSDIRHEEEEIFSPCAAAALYHRKSVMDVGGFDESYFCYSEDVDLAFRLRARGSKAWYLPNAVVHHAGSATTGRRSDFSVYHGHRNLVWTFFKNMPGMYLWWFLPQHLLLNLASIIHFTLRGQGITILRAKRDALIGLPRIITSRRLQRYLRLVKPIDLITPMRRGLLTPYKNRHD